jgi:hypothetical protein
MRIMLFVCSLALPVGILLGAVNGAGAQGSDEVRQACTPDAMRLCSEFIPDAERVKKCMLSKRSQLSEPCRTAMAKGRKAGGREGHHHGRVHCGKHSKHCG